MSFILSALRKAEQERKRESEAGAEEWDAADWNTLDSSNPSKQPTVIVVATLVALSLCILVLLWLLLHDDGRPSVQPSAVAVEEESLIAESLPLDASPPSSSTSESITPGTSNRQDEELLVENTPVPNVSAATSQLSDQLLPTITGHLFFPSNTSLNRLFGVEGSYRVGHRFDNGLELIEITQYEAVFSHGNEIYEMPLNR